ncbi:MAG: hypothetical protein JNK78_10860 [Planctomycetes bacterium]|nr:hypothetical protein [Planctomycetota bacterium]
MPDVASGPARSRAGLTVFFALVALTGALVALLVAPFAAPPAAAAVAEAPVEPAVEAAPVAPAATAAVLPPADDEVPQRTDAAPPPAAPPPTFEQRVDELADLGLRTAAFAAADDFAAAKEADGIVRRRFAELLDAFPDAGERALAAFAANDETDPAVAPPITAADPLGNGRRLVLQLITIAECERRHTAAIAAGDHSRSDALVQNILDLAPIAPALAELCDQTLGDRPWLRLPHEPSVLTIVRLAGEDRVPRKVATRLLLTLWDNLQRSGERSSDELARLALLLFADTDPSKRIAATRHLLTDARYRPMVLAWLREQQDGATAIEVAGLAARELEPAAALDVLRELGPILPRAPAAYMVLAARAPSALADAYRELLASNTQPGMRQDLVAGVGFSGAAEGRTVAELALRHDPSPDVRIQAVFALSATDTDAGERAISELLDDPRIAKDPNHLGALVLAMQNLEAGRNLNAIDRLGRRLRTMALSESGRVALEALLARSLPGGAPSSDPGTPR